MSRRDVDTTLARRVSEIVPEELKGEVFVAQKSFHPLFEIIPTAELIQKRYIGSFSSQGIALVRVGSWYLGPKKEGLSTYSTDEFKVLRRGFWWKVRIGSQRYWINRQYSNRVRRLIQLSERSDLALVARDVLAEFMDKYRLRMAEGTDVSIVLESDVVAVSVYWETEQGYELDVRVRSIAAGGGKFSIPALLAKSDLESADRYRDWAATNAGSLAAGLLRAVELLEEHGLDFLTGDLRAVGNASVAFDRLQEWRDARPFRPDLP